jgi:5-methyltetrahydrofolate--homocysteine methyltransferase
VRIGKPVVNSISMKEGAQLLDREIGRASAAAIVMAFDCVHTFERRSNCALTLLTRQVGSYDIILTRTFSPSPPASTSTTTTPSTHQRDAAISSIWPHAKISGGVSMSAARATTRYERFTPCSVHAIKAGMTMGIVNAGNLRPSDELSPRPWRDGENPPSAQ